MDIQMGSIATMGPEGDTTYTWDRDNPAECDAARRHFEEMRRRSFIVFRTRWYGLRQETVDTFDPSEGKYVFKDGVIPPADQPYRTEAPVMATSFDPRADYVAIPPIAGG